MKGNNKAMNSNPKPPTLVDFAGNDYLGLARDPRVVEALYRGAQQFGVSSTSSRWALGWTELLGQLEEELADFFGVEQAGVMGKGFFGGPAYFAVMAQHHDAVYCDEYSHTNLLIGIKTADLELHAYRHLDADDLRHRLRSHRGRPPIIATDSVFAISGELAPLNEIAEIAQEFEAELLVDEAHSVFTMGPSGKGAVEACGLSPARFTLQGGMSKAMGTDGGFLAGREEIIGDCLHAPPPSGSADPPNAILAASLEALRIIREEPQRRATLDRNAQKMRQILADHDIAIVSDQTPIIAMLLDDGNEASRLAAHFLSYGIRIPYFSYPAEPRQNMLRAVARSCYTTEHLSRFTDAVESWSKNQTTG